MAKVICPKCGKTSESSNLTKSKFSQIAAGGLVGAISGSQIGIVAGPLGGIAGTVPGALIGAATIYFGHTKFVKCECCGKIFSL
tara:strand:- start:341 stop:592 length:252 start_codon:yes stop_codon:yes gene_type:complete